MVKSILFVCTGNTCRSVMAEHLLKHYSQAAGLDLKIASAGLRACEGDVASKHALSSLGELGIDAGSHRSQAVRRGFLEEYDLILAMTAGHARELLDLAPEFSGRMALLQEFSQRKVSSGQDLEEEIEKDIQDPFGQSLEVYRRTRDQIAEAVGQIVKYLSAEKEENMNIAIGSDHGGYQVKQEVLSFLSDGGFAVQDFGTFSQESCDYPDIARPVAEAVVRGDFDLGILICGTGIGMSLAANKVPGIRAALCQDTYSARMAREHNDSNVLCLGGRVTGPGLMLDIVETYLESRFIGGRHARRVAKIEQPDK